MSNPETGLSLSEAFTYLIGARQRNFYAKVINALIRIEKPGLGTCGVGIDRQDRFVFYYDPEFVKKCPLQELVLVCEHEVYHLLLGHIPRFLELLCGLSDPEERRRFQAVMNLAVDCAADELIRKEPNFDKQWGTYFYGSEETDGRSFLIPETFGLPRNMPYEVYQLGLLQNIQKISQKIAGLTMTTLSVPMPGAGQQGQQNQPGQGQQGQGQQGQGQGQGQGQQPGAGQQQGGAGQQPTPHMILETYFEGQGHGAHQFWQEGVKGKASDEIQGLADKLRQQTKNVIRDAVTEHAKSRGTIPAGLQEIIDELLKPPVIPWPEVLRNFCVKTRQTKTGRGMSRPSRRMHGIPDVMPFPGRARDRKFTVYFALDTSGSMSTEDCQMGLVELCHLAKADADITIFVMYCDTRIDKLYKVESVDDVDWEVSGRGGTDFDPIFKKAQDLLSTDRAADILVVCTDGYAPDPQPENRVPIPVVWLITPTGRLPSPNYGFHIQMEPF